MKTRTSWFWILMLLAAMILGPFFILNRAIRIIGPDRELRIAIEQERLLDAPRDPQGRPADRRPPQPAPR